MCRALDTQTEGADRVPGARHWGNNPAPVTFPKLLPQSTRICRAGSEHPGPALRPRFQWEQAWGSETLKVPGRHGALGLARIPGGGCRRVSRACCQPGPVRHHQCLSAPIPGGPLSQSTGHPSVPVSVRWPPHTNQGHSKCTPGQPRAGEADQSQL